MSGLNKACKKVFITALSFAFVCFGLGMDLFHSVIFILGITIFVECNRF